MKITASYRVKVELPSSKLYFTEVENALREMKSKGVPSSAELRVGDHKDVIYAVWETELDSIN